MPGHTEHFAGGAGPAPQSGLFTQGTVLQVGAHSCVVQRFLSAGGHANVYLVTLISDGAERVLKHIPLSDRSADPELRQQVEQEIKAMSQLNGHPQIVGLDATEIAADCAYILMEYCPSDLLQLMNARISERLDEPTILHIFSDVCKAVAHMHYQPEPLLHRDLKAENVLIAANGSYKLCDFGSATSTTIAPGARLPREQIVLLEDEIQRMTTLEYRAPEMIDLYLRRGVTEKADIWALGVLLYKLCYFKTPFDNASPLAILNAEYSIPQSPVYSKQLRHVFQMTLREEPRERSTIYTLTTYVCGLRGESCMLENKYASPPASPADPYAVPRNNGLGCVSAQPAGHQPRRYAASKNPYGSASGNGSDVNLNASANVSLNAASSDAISELDSGLIVPMRRGRPTRQQGALPGSVVAAASSSSASPGISRASSPSAKHVSAFSSRFGLPHSGIGKSSFENSAPRATPAASQTTTTTTAASTLSATTTTTSMSSAMSVPVASLANTNVDVSEAFGGANGAVDASNRTVDNVSDTGEVSAGDPVSAATPPGTTRRMRMSVRAPDGRESMSVDFVQGAVFGSARRTSLLRRNPSAASNASSSSQRATARSDMESYYDDVPPSPLTALSRKSTTGSFSPMSRSMSVGELADELSAEGGLPGFVCQPLPPPPPMSPQSAPVRTAPMDSQSANEPRHNGSAGEYTALTNAMAPLPLNDRVHSQAQGNSAVGMQKQGGVSGNAAENSMDGEAASAAFRLSTILEACQNDASSRAKDDPWKPAADSSSGAGAGAWAPSKSIYEVTLDKLEEDSRYSMVFEDQLLFNAKAKYAAQRSSVYQSPDSYFSFGNENGQQNKTTATTMAEAAQQTWNGISPDDMDSLMRKMDQYSKGCDNKPLQENKDDPWSVASQPPQPQTQDQQPSETSAEEPLSMDMVLQRAGRRNRQKLIAQNNRRSQYIFGGTSDTAFATSPEILKEDVEDNMRVLSEQEIEELLAKMDMYNRELLSEQKKWQSSFGAQKFAGAASADDNGQSGTDLESTDLQSLEGILARANDQLLRTEQQQQQQGVSSAGAGSGWGAKRRSGRSSGSGSGVGLLKNVFSVAKQTFSKSGASSGASTPPSVSGTVDPRAWEPEEDSTSKMSITELAAEAVRAAKVAKAAEAARGTPRVPEAATANTPLPLGTTTAGNSDISISEITPSSAAVSAATAETHDNSAGQPSPTYAFPAPATSMPLDLPHVATTADAAAAAAAPAKPPRTFAQPAAASSAETSGSGSGNAKNEASTGAVGSASLNLEADGGGSSSDIAPTVEQETVPAATPKTDTVSGIITAAAAAVPTEPYDSEVLTAVPPASPSTAPTEAAAEAAAVTATVTATPSPTEDAVTAVTANPPSPLPAPKLPALSRVHTDTPVSKKPNIAETAASTDPLAEARMRLKKKQSTPLLTTTASANAASPVFGAGAGAGAARASAFKLGAQENKSVGSLPLPSPVGAAAVPLPKKPGKSVRNLVAMFEKS
ncbi:Ark- serine/threonine protein kinase [Coemansia sp. Benny D115]|nr:Ark- serine/threonine protein kinase [Coemansia sp. Benny D115]